MQQISKSSTTVWDELNHWGGSLPNWQRFIVSHAVRDGVLSNDKIDEAYSLFFRETKLDAGTEQLPVPPETVTGRASATTSNPLNLKEIRNLCRVNAIPSTSALVFGDALTVIYGHNGSGKSGFARMLSCACFSRCNHEITDNIHGANPTEAPATAEIIIDQGNSTPEQIMFKVGDEHPTLKRIGVFDASEAQIHLSKENPLGFQPAGFDVFDEIVRVIGIMGAKLDAAITSASAPHQFNKLFIDPSNVATLIKGLNSKSDVVALRKIGTFGDPEKARLEQVKQQEIETASGSPHETLRLLHVARNDVEFIEKKINELNDALSSEVCESAKNLLVDHAKIMKAATAESEHSIKHPSFQHIGTEPWHKFVEASNVLGELEGATYPNISAPCLLCHRPLDEPSEKVIRRMWASLDASARTALQVSSKEIDRKIQKICDLNTSLLPVDSRSRSDLSKIDSDLVNALDSFSSVLEKRRDTIVSGLDCINTDNIPSQDILLPNAVLAESLRKIDFQIAELNKGKFESTLQALKNERIDLRHRQVLSHSVDEIVKHVANLNWVDQAVDAKRKLNTRFATTKQKAIFKIAIEGAYKEQLDKECNELDCALPFEFKARGAGGQTVRGLKARGGHKPDKIFSEGEQRALALADFLTEVNLNPDSAGIILDDPVTSMDHLRKVRIARRLTEEAKKRQVIVFTHDLVFLTTLTAEAKNKSVGFVGHWIDRLDDSPGHVIQNETPASTKAYLKTTKAKDCLALAKKALGDEKVDAVRRGAGSLRRTLEEVVIKHVLKDVVQRWDEQIRLGAISKINWSNDVADEVIALQGDASRMIEGHSNSDEFTGGVPDVDGLECLIQRMDLLIAKAKMDRR